MKSFELDSSTTIRYWTYHDASKPVIIMIHGFTGSHKGFMYLEPLLDDFHLIVPDLPGFGESDLHDEKDWNIEGIARILNELVASLGLTQPPAILGHSMGGLVVSSMVEQHQELYSDVILISPVPTAIRHNDSRLPGAVLGALQYRIGAKTGRIGNKLVTSRTISKFATYLMTHTNDRERKRAIVEHHYENLRFLSSIRFYEKLYSDINRRGAIDYAKSLAQKRVLLITGDRDNVTPLKLMNKLAETITPESYHVIPDVGHLIHYEKTKEASGLINSFLRK